MSSSTTYRRQLRSLRLATSLPLLAVLAALLLPAAGWAQMQTPPEPQAAKEVKIPNWVDRTLDNGLRVIFIEQHEQPSVSLRLVVHAGSLYEPADRPGLAGAVSAMITQGTSSRSAQQIAEAIDFVGGSLNASSDEDLASVSAFVTSDQLDLALDLLADVVLRPTFPAEELERQRTQGLSGLKVSMSNPTFLAGAAFDRAVFGNHPYGQPASGTLESLSSMTRDELVAFHQRHYLPNGSILAVVGDIRPEAALAKVKKALGGWARGTAPEPPKVVVQEASARRVIVIDKPDAVQTEIRVGQVGLAYDDPDFFTAQVYNTIVGGGVSARLYEEIRRKRGLSYGANSSLTPQLQPGYFRASTFTKSESTVETVGLVMSVLEGMQGDLVPADELQQRKTFITGAFPMLLETPDGIASMVLQVLPYGKDKAFLDSYRDRLDAVTAEQVRDFARRRIHPEHMVIVLAGNAAAFGAELEKAYGKVETIPIADLDLMQADLRRPAELQPAASEEERQAALALAQKAVAALGGETFLAQRTQIARGTGTLTPPGAPQPMAVDSLVSYLVWPNKMRSEFTLGGVGTAVQAYDGEHGWANMAGHTQDLTEMMSSRLPFGYFALRSFNPETFDVRPLPPAEVDGRTLPGVELTDPAGHVNQLYVDPDTYLMVKMSYEVDGSVFEEQYSDFRLQDGIQVPYHAVFSQDGHTMFEVRFEEVRINPEVDEGVFTMPQG